MNRKVKNVMIPADRIEKAIFLIRGLKVMIDADLSDLYDVPTKALNQAVGRNIRRFPQDFMFRLTKEEKNELVTNKRDSENQFLNNQPPNLLIHQKEFSDGLNTIEKAYF
jgi:ORF6N domain-containing protein